VGLTVDATRYPRERKMSVLWIMDFVEGFTTPRIRVVGSLAGARGGVAQAIGRRLLNLHRRLFPGVAIRRIRPAPSASLAIGATLSEREEISRGIAGPSSPLDGIACWALARG